MRAPCLVILLLVMLPLQSAETDPLWDGKETVATYATRAHLEPTKTLDLGNEVKLELVLIPAGQFVMGTPEPKKPTITVESAIVLMLIGAALATSVFVMSVWRIPSRHRFSFSLRGLLAFCLACSLIVWGGARWHQALDQFREYEAEMALYNAAHSNEKPAHLVTLTRPFYMGKYAVTQEQYEAIMGTNPSRFKGTQLPVETTSWDDATVFCKKLNEKLLAQSGEARLPTEAQWEYSCRAGTKTRFYSGNLESALDELAWYKTNSGRITHRVGDKKANAFGLYDLYGNVHQWCRDAYTQDYATLNATDPFHDEPGNMRVLRGSYFYSRVDDCGSANRNEYNSDAHNFSIGFRVVLSVPPSKASQ